MQLARAAGSAGFAGCSGGPSLPAAAATSRAALACPPAPRQRRHRLAASPAAADAGGGQPEEGPPPPSSNSSSSSSSSSSTSSGQVTSQQAALGAWGRVKRFFTGDKELTRAKLAELGLGAFAAYGIVSNMNAGVLMAISWLSIVKRFGACPLEQGLWSQFLLTYAGLYIGSNFLRPIRLSVALAAAPLVNTFLEALQRRTGANKAVAFGLLLAMIATGSFTAIFGTIAALGGFPNGVPLAPWQRAVAS